MRGRARTDTPPPAPPTSGPRAVLQPAGTPPPRSHPLPVPARAAVQRPLVLAGWLRGPALCPPVFLASRTLLTLFLCSASFQTSSALLRQYRSARVTTGATDGALSPERPGFTDAPSLAPPFPRPPADAGPPLTPASGRRRAASDPPARAAPFAVGTRLLGSGAQILAPPLSARLRRAAARDHDFRGGSAPGESRWTRGCCVGSAR